ncbi:hypothetical protein NKR23_g8848 [Pleurostoma richardsiae]|uniref:Uncharacterized protein n=1 Tax=Pleurostoma richardsiae TaxID=41990 RepID=A0AA38RH95_9PEZI|nr:hypothetical protein NKR23_g8848 [Pleurostoma richardsiae]
MCRPGWLSSSTPLSLSALTSLSSRRGLFCEADETRPAIDKELNREALIVVGFPPVRPVQRTRSAPHHPGQTRPIGRKRSHE